MMKKLIAITTILLLIIVVGYKLSAQQQTVGGQVSVVSSNPSNCTLGTLYFNTATNLLSVCKATDMLITVMVAPMRGTIGTITGTLLALGACNTGTATVTGATTTMEATASPVSDPGSTVVWHAWVSSANTVTVKECELILGTPNNTAFNVTVNP